MKYLTYLLLSFIFISCVTTQIPMSSKINDFVLMGTKSNSKVTAVFNYKSKVQDGEMPLYGKDQQDTLANKIEHSEASTFHRMAKEYITNKFTNIATDKGDVQINVLLDDFVVEQYTNDSGGKQALTALFGGETSFILAAKVKLKIDIAKDGNTYQKVITGSSEDTFISGVGTGTSTSNVHKGENSLEHVHARNINSANNKALMMLNAYFEELGL